MHILAFEIGDKQHLTPADDISQAYFQESGCWMPVALLSTDLLLYCSIQNLLAALLVAQQLTGRKPRHIENVLVLANCLEGGCMAITI